MTEQRHEFGEPGPRGLVPWQLDLPQGAPPPAGYPLLVALHGFGENAALFSRRLPLNNAPYARLFPTGPLAAEHTEGRSWYAYDGDQKAFLAELERAEAELLALVLAVTGSQPLDATRLALLGYSQGGYLAGFTALRQRETFKGLVAMSCRVKTEVLDLEGAADYPVLIIHGAKDAEVRLEPQRTAATDLQRAGCDVRLSLHPGGHGLPRRVVPVVDAFVRDVLEV